jgi:hypothetical protein
VTEDEREFPWHVTDDETLAMVRERLDESLKLKIQGKKLRLAAAGISVSSSSICISSYYICVLILLHLWLLGAFSMRPAAANVGRRMRTRHDTCIVVVGGHI